MPCESCYSLAETIRELEAKVRRLESMKEPMFHIHVPNPPHPDLDTWINFNPTKELGLSW